MNYVYLTRRNLQTLLNKLDRNKQEGADASACTLLKGDTKHKLYPCSAPTIVTAVEDEDYYTDREPGFTLDAPKKCINAVCEGVCTFCKERL